MDITSPYVPTATQLSEATRFTNFSADLSIVYDEAASARMKRDHWKVTESFRFYLDTKGDQPVRWAYVPAGFLTDGATVPRPFWWLIPPWGSYGQASVLHDLLCETRTVFCDEIPQAISRKDADVIFNQAMKAAKVNTFIRLAMYAGVRTYGFFKRNPNYKRIAKKRDLEIQYQKEYGTYREPTAILTQVTKALRRSVSESHTKALQ